MAHFTCLNKRNCASFSFFHFQTIPNNFFQVLRLQKPKSGMILRPTKNAYHLPRLLLYCCSYWFTIMQKGKKQAFAYVHICKGIYSLVEERDGRLFSSANAVQIVLFLRLLKKLCKLATSIVPCLLLEGLINNALYFTLPCTAQEKCHPSCIRIMHAVSEPSGSLDTFGVSDPSAKSL